MSEFLRREGGREGRVDKTFWLPIELDLPVKLDRGYMNFLESIYEVYNADRIKDKLLIN